MSNGFSDAESTSEALEGTLTREIKEVSEEIYDAGEPVAKRQFVPKQTAPTVSQRRLSKKVLWTIIALVALGLAVAALAVGNLQNG